MSEEFVPIERELWNTAKIYSVTHVADPLVLCRKLITVCLFGVEEIGQENFLEQNTLNQNKISAINRLLQELKQLVSDNINFMKKNDRLALEVLDKRLEKVETVIDGVSTTSSDQRNKDILIELNHQHFILCFEELRKINSELKKHLSDLIFPSGDDYDLEKLKRDIIEGG